MGCRSPGRRYLGSCYLYRQTEQRPESAMGTYLCAVAAGAGCRAASVPASHDIGPVVRHQEIQLRSKALSDVQETRRTRRMWTALGRACLLLRMRMSRRWLRGRSEEHTSELQSPVHLVC